MRQALILLPFARGFANPVLEAQVHHIDPPARIPEVLMMEWFPKETLAALERSGVFMWVESLPEPAAPVTPVSPTRRSWWARVARWITTPTEK